MDYRPLGRTGVSVSQLCLGAMMFGAFGNPDHDDSIRIIHRALDAGINFIDTADFYSAGESEAIVGKALAGGRRDDGVHLVDVERLQQLALPGEVAIQRGHPDPRAARHLRHRHLGRRVGEGFTGGSEDLLAVALGVCAFRGHGT